MSLGRYQSSKNYQLSVLYRDIHRIFTNDEKDKNKIIRNLKTDYLLFSKQEISNNLDELLILGKNHVRIVLSILYIIDTNFSDKIMAYYNENPFLSYSEKLQYLIDEIAVMRDELSSNATENLSILKNPTKTPVIPGYLSYQYQSQSQQQAEKYFEASQVFGVITGIFIGAAIAYFLGPEIGVNAGTQTFELCLLLGAGIGSLCGWGAGKKMMSPASNLAPSASSSSTTPITQSSPSRNLHRDFSTYQKPTTRSDQTTSSTQQSLLTLQLRAQQISNLGAGVNRSIASNGLGR